MKIIFPLIGSLNTKYVCKLLLNTVFQSSRYCITRVIQEKLYTWIFIVVCMISANLLDMNMNIDDDIHFEYVQIIYYE